MATPEANDHMVADPGQDWTTQDLETLEAQARADVERWQQWRLDQGLDVDLAIILDPEDEAIDEALAYMQDMDEDGGKT